MATAMTPAMATVMDLMLVTVRHAEVTLILITGDTAFVTTTMSDTTAPTGTTIMIMITITTTATTTMMTTPTATMVTATMTVTAQITAMTGVGDQTTTTVTHAVTMPIWMHGDTVHVTMVGMEITVTCPMIITMDMDIPMNADHTCTTMNTDTVAVTSTGRVMIVTSMSTILMTHIKDHVTQSAMDAPAATQLSATSATTMPTGTPQANVSVTSTGLVMTV